MVEVKSTSVLAAEFIAQGCPAAQAWELAGNEFNRMSAIVAEQQKQAMIDASKNSGNRETVNIDGLPSISKTSGKGYTFPLVTSHMVVLVEGGSNKQGVQFGPKLRFYQRQYATSLKASPDPVDFGGGSSNSTCDVEFVPCIQFAEFIAKTDCRLFVKNPPLENGDPAPAEEFTDRDAWLKTVRDEVGMFFDDVSDAKAAALKTKRR